MRTTLHDSAARFCATTGLLLLLAPGSLADTRVEPWSETVIELAESLPIQDGGRVKPLHTFAGFTLLRLSGKRSLKTPHGERLSQVEWLLDTLFYPELAATYPVFIVQNSEVVEAIGISLEGKKKRDRYSLDELRPAIPRLFELARQYGQIEDQERSPVQQQVYMLAGNVNYYTQLLTHMDFARSEILLDGEELSDVFPDRSEVAFHEVVAQLSQLRAIYAQLAQDHAGGGADRLQAIASVMQQASSLADGTETMALIPPSEPLESAQAWLTPAEILLAAFEREPEPVQVEILAGFERLAQSRADPALFERELAALHGRVRGLGEARGELDKVGLELTYYKAKLLSYSHYLFILSFLTMAFMWLRPRGKLLYVATWALVAAGTAFLSAGITMRCLIRDRPPVSTLYETVLFVTAVGALIALFIETVNRQKIAISAAALLGLVGLFIANGYEVLDKRDTMPSLVAVLDTNFWLATHVTSITIGYSAGMLAALLGSVYLLAKPFAKRLDRAFFRNLSRMVYGVICFGLIFSLVGTILGGIWANDSWGRFWGWDPKENGALLIVISQILILHARMGGYLREHGICMAAAFGGTVVAFSWWGVNLLGVGLHSYGFTSGISKALWTYYTLQWGIVGLGAVTWLVQRSASQRMQTRAPRPSLEQDAGGALA